MFSFFQKNSYLRDIVPPNYIDIHSHLLPGIDDGAQTLEQSYDLINGLTEIGFSQIITTPHIMHNVYENSFESINKTHNQTLIDLKNIGVEPKLKAAAEYMLDDNFLHLLHSGKMLTLGDKHILIEMSYLSAPLQLFEIIFDIQVAGYVPILAHPERYNFYHGNFSQYQKLKNAGCKFQVNLLSSIGYYGTAVNEAASKLLQSGMIDFAGSDVHHEKHLNSFQKKVNIKNIAPLKEAMSNNNLFTS